MNIEAQIRTRLAQLQPASVAIADDSAAHAGHAGAASGGGHYTVAIVADAFTGKSRVARHRLVYDALGNLMQQQIHALALTTHAPNEI
jgi:BolA family transcriptional regulator, general stress-responsive regulator